MQIFQFWVWGTLGPDSQETSGRYGFISRPEARDTPLLVPLHF